MGGLFFRPIEKHRRLTSQDEYFIIAVPLKKPEGDGTLAGRVVLFLLGMEYGQNDSNR